MSQTTHESQLSMKVFKNAKGIIILDFSKSIKWLALDVPTTLALCKQLLELAEDKKTLN